MSTPPGLWQPPPAQPSRCQYALSCAVTLLLVVAAVFAWRTQVLAQVVVQRAWPLHLYQTNSRHYQVLVAPEDAPYPDPLGPSYTTINAVGQVLVYDTLWTPPGIAGAEAQVVDFFAVLQADPGASRLEVTALNDYGQVAGALLSGNRSALFLWTPLHAHGSVGTVTYLTDPAVQDDRGAARGLNEYGQVAMEWANKELLWTPDAANSPKGTASLIQPVEQAGASDLRGPNSDGQVAGVADGRSFLWTPDQPQGTTGAVMWFSDELGYLFALNDFGQVVGDADEQAAVLWTPTQPHATSGRFTRIPKPGGDHISISELSASGALVGLSLSVAPLQASALVWLPDAPNAPTGQLQMLGAVGWNEEGER